MVRLKFSPGSVVMANDGERPRWDGASWREPLRLCNGRYREILSRIAIGAPIGRHSANRALRYYGIDMATRAELIGADLSEQEICDFVGADSLHYVTLDGLIAATPNERENLCTACFTGDYPIPVPGEHEQLAQVKFDFEALAATPDVT